MTRLEKAVDRLELAVREVFGLTGAYSIRLDDDGRVELMLNSPVFDKLPGGSQAKKEPRDSDYFPFYKRVRVGPVVFECLLEPDPKQSKDGE